MEIKTDTQVEESKIMEEAKVKVEDVQAVKKEVKVDENTKNEMKSSPISGQGDTVGSRKYSSTFNELQAIQNTVKSFKLVDLLVPVLSLISLVLLSIFVYIPMITSGIQYIKDEKVASENIVKLNKLALDLENVDSARLQQDLADARAVIPYSLQVSDFVSYIDKLAQAKGLEFKEILAGDIVLRDPTSKKGLDPVMRGVSGPLKYSGSLNQITAFFDDLQSTSPFILSADQIVMKRKDGSSNWDIALNITGFYLDRTSIPKIDIYAQFIPYTDNQTIMDIFSLKAKTLKNN